MTPTIEGLHLYILFLISDQRTHLAFNESVRETFGSMFDTLDTIRRIVDVKHDF